MPTEPVRREAHPGLCATCRHARQVETPRARYWMCERSLTDPSFAKYPRLPVLACPGYEKDEPEAK